jgi:hypothetical protein
VEGRTIKHTSSIIQPEQLTIVQSLWVLARASSGAMLDCQACELSSIPPLLCCFDRYLTHACMYLQAERFSSGVPNPSTTTKTCVRPVCYGMHLLGADLLAHSNRPPTTKFCPPIKVCGGLAVSIDDLGVIEVRVSPGYAKARGLSKPAPVRQVQHRPIGYVPRWYLQVQAGEAHHQVPVCDLLGSKV